MPPKALAEVAVAADAPLPGLLLDELAPLDELLLHPAAKTRLPIAAVAAIAYLPRKVPSRAQAIWRARAIDCGWTGPHHG